VARSRRVRARQLAIKARKRLLEQLGNLGDFPGAVATIATLLVLAHALEASSFAVEPLIVCAAGGPSKT